LSSPQSPPWLDKLEHFTAFGGLTVILCVAGASFWPVTWRLYAGIVGLVALYGVIDELTQFFVPGRQPDPRDWLANVTGSLAGVAIFAVVRSLRTKTAEKSNERAPDR
jgi:VanZ family protein